MQKQERDKRSSNKGVKMLCIAMFMLFTLLLCAKSAPATHKDSIITPLGNNKFQMTFQDCMLVSQDGKWVAPEKARSLKDSGCYEWVLTNEGKEQYIVEVVDYNMTSVTLKFPSTETIPVTIYERNTESTLNTKNPKDAIALGAYTQKTVKTGVVLKDGVTLPIKMTDIIKIGDNSSYLQSQPAGVTGIDTIISSNHPDHSNGVYDTFLVGYDAEIFVGLIQPNWTGMGLYSANVTSINNINLSLKTWMEAEDTVWMVMYPMLTCWQEGIGVPWTAGDASWNYNDSDSNRNWLGGIANTDYNASLMIDNKTIVGAVSYANSVWWNWSINSSIANAMFKKTVPDCGFIMMSFRVAGVSNNIMRMATSDHATATSRPIWFITFTEAGGSLTWSNVYNNASAATYAAGDVNWTANISDNVALSYAILETNDTGTWANLTPVKIGGTNYNFSYTKTIVSSANKYVCGRIWFNNSQNNANQTNDSCFIVAVTPDSIPPTWINVYSNASTITLNGGMVNWTANLSDETNLNAAILTTNDTGTWANESTITFSGKSYNFSYSKTITASVGEYVCGRIWFQDANNNANETDNSCFIVITSLNLKLKDIYDSSYILNFTVTLNTSQTATTNDGNISLDGTITEGTYELNFTNVNDNTYFNKSYIITVSGDRYNFTGSTYQSILSITAYTKITNVQIKDFNVSANQTHENMTTNGYMQLYVRAGTYRLRANSSNSSRFPYTIYNDSITVLPFQNKSVILYFHNAELNVSAKNFFGDDVIANFTINISYPTYNYFEEKSTTTGTIWFNITQGTYNLVIWNNTEQIDNATISVTKTPYNHTFYLLKAGNLYLRVYNEETLALLNASIDLIGASQTGNYSTSNGTLLFSGLSIGDYELRYANTGYRPRQYFFTLTGGGAEVIDLYLLNNLNGSYVVITVYDENGVELEGVKLKLLRYYVAEEGYITVAMTKTNFNGQGQIDAVLNTVHYQIIGEYEGKTVFISTDTAIFQTAMSMTVDTSTDVMQKISLIKDFSYLLTFNNDTKTFTLAFNDVSGAVNSVCLDTIKFGALSNDQVCNSCLTTSAGTISCNISAWSGYTDKGNYLARVKIFYDDVWWTVGQLEKTFSQPLAFSSPSFAMFLDILFIIAMISMSLVNPIISIILTCFGLIMLNLWGMAVLPLTVIVPIILVGGLLAMFMRRT